MNAKEEIMRLLERLPEDASLEDIQYHIYVHQKDRPWAGGRRGGAHTLGGGVRPADGQVARTVRWSEAAAPDPPLTAESSLEGLPLLPPQKPRKPPHQLLLILLPPRRHEEGVFSGDRAYDLGHVGAVDGEGYDSGGAGA